MTPREVHFAIQQMNNKLSLNSKILTVSSIAQNMHVSNDELLVNIHILQNLYYINFIGHSYEKIRLTYSGLNTIVPQ